jgi:alpha-mannosidase
MKYVEGEFIMKKHSAITLQRLQTYKEERGIKGFIYPEKSPVKLFVYHAPGRVTYQEAISSKFTETKVGEFLGPAWSTHWFLVEISIPEKWEGQEVHLLWDSSSEACIWIDGEPRQGLTGTGTMPWEANMGRLAYRITQKASENQKALVYIEMACNGLFGTEPKTLYQLKQVEIGLFDPLAWGLYWDYMIIADMAEFLPKNSPRAGQALWTANEMINIINPNDKSTWQEAREYAAKFLSETNGASQHNLSAIGYAHLDTAWLWPLAETKRKIVRTFSTTMRLMEDYASYKFASAQAQHLVWLREFQPDLYNQVKSRILEGRFVLVGGSWIEPDCNIPSGESLIRQFLFGQNFYLEEFGIRCEEFWNPDVFGYSAALPQIMRGCGIKYFLTQKLSWNQINKPANHTFIWEGLDGSQILTHFPPADTYGSAGNVADVVKSVDLFKEHDRAKESILIFGWGDGGGGPTPGMIEQIIRMSDVDELPRVQIRTVNEFFKRCESDIKDPAKWVGELYFEYHRGTYTTQAANKRDNRRCELLLRDVEILSSLNFIDGNNSYPKVELDKLWKVVLLNQFHDILPGSSIREVYEDSAKDYDAVLREGSSLRQSAIEKLSPAGNHWIAFNTLSKSRVDVIEIEGMDNSIQQSHNGKALAIVDAAPFAFAKFDAEFRIEKEASLELTLEGYKMENQFLSLILTPGGQITSLLFKEISRQAVANECLANQFVLYEDDPINFEAWDVDVFHLEKKQKINAAVNSRVVETGPIRVAVEFEYEISQSSSIVQTVLLTAISPRIEFHTKVNWHEAKRFLKVEFPWEIRSEQATYEIQFGHVQRPTHFNTSWDLARFEVCAHKWADLSEPGFGMAVLNDSKYGYSTLGNVMSLSLLRSPKSPDPEADMGEHFFKYALLPHQGSFRDGGVIDEGYRFNVPLLVHRSDIDHDTRPFFNVDHPSIVIDTVKKAEHDDALIIRLFESYGGRCQFKLSSKYNLSSVYLCNFLEEIEHELHWHEGGVVLKIKPFQVLTIKLVK